MKRETNEVASSSKNTSRWKFIPFIKKRSAPLIIAALLAWCSSTDILTSDIKTIKIGKWATLSTIVRDSLWLSPDITSDPKLCRILIDNIAEQNNIPDINNINLDSTLVINMDSINATIDSYKEDTLNVSEQWNKKEQWEEINKWEDAQINNIELNHKEDTPYTTINSVEEFKKSDNYLIKKIYRDKNINWKFFEALNAWYSIKFLNSRETKDNPTYTLDEITKPKEIVWEELKGKKFILDPGHWSLDTWAIGLAQYWNETNKEKVAVYESAVMMDLTYRIARELRSHGAEVKLTHYMNRRWIMDVKDLPPCSRVFDDKWNEIYQDIWDGMEEGSEWTFFKADGQYLTKRAKIANKYNPKLFVSLHADILRSGENIDDKSKILSIKYDERQGNKESESIAKQLLDNWFAYYYNGDISRDVKRNVDKQHLWVLRPAKSPAILIEFWNISQESQAYILREYTKREELAKNFVSALIKTYETSQPSKINNKSKELVSNLISTNSTRKYANYTHVTDNTQQSNNTQQPNSVQQVNSTLQSDNNIQGTREYKIYKLWLGSIVPIKWDIQKAKAKISNIPKLSNILTWKDIEFETILPSIIKESMMDNDAKNKSGAVGYFQIKPIAVKDVEDFYKINDLKLDANNPIDNIILWSLYRKRSLNLIKNQLKMQLSDYDLEKMMILSYNAWAERTKNLFKESKAKNYKEFENFLAKKIWARGKPTKKRDKTYWVDYIDPLTDFNIDNLKTKEDKKIAEWLRYVAIIDWISKYIKANETIQILWKITCDKNITLFSAVKDLRNQWIFKKDASINEICKIILETNWYWERETPTWVDLLVIKDALVDYLP